MKFRPAASPKGANVFPNTLCVPFSSHFEKRSLATRFFPPMALVMGALLFSLYHMRIVQLVPTFTLGIALGYLALRADSVLPCMLAHFVNNAIALVVTRGDAPPIARAVTEHPHVALGVFVTLCVMGLWLASGHSWRPRRE